MSIFNKATPDSVGEWGGQEQLEVLIKNARIECELKSIIRDNGFLSTSNKVDYVNLFKFMREKYPDDLSWYRQEKSSGYRAIALYKGAAMCGIADFLTDIGREIQQLPHTNEWPVDQLHRLKLCYLNKIFHSPWDGRTKLPHFKPTAERQWNEAKKELLGFLI